MFIWMGDADKADPALLPSLDAIGFDIAGSEVHPISVHEIACRYQLLNDNLLDLSHLSFLHGRTTGGGTEDAETPEELDHSATMLRSRRYIRDRAPPAFLASLYPDLPDRVDRISGMDFHLPGFHAGISTVKRQENDTASPGRIIHDARVFHAVTPSTPTRSYYWFASGNRPEAIAFIRENVKQVIDEDIFASEAIEKMLQLLGHSPKELMLKTDTGAVRARRLLQAMMDKERPGG